MKIFLSLLAGGAIVGLAAELAKHRQETKFNFGTVADSIEEVEKEVEDFVNHRLQETVEEIRQALEAGKQVKVESKRGYE